MHKTTRLLVGVVAAGTLTACGGESPETFEYGSQGSL